MKEFRNQTALITGASAGIGEAFARKLASRGANLFLVARTEEKLRSLSDELQNSYGVRADYFALDLSTDGAAARLFDETDRHGVKVDLLINNAGFGSFGEFCALPVERELQMIHLNIVALVDLTHRYLNAMLARRRGAIINVASTAGFQPLPFMATYAATKAFVLNFSEALWVECKDRGVQVLAACPGATRTEFFDAARVKGRPPDAMMQSADEVVESALAALAARQSSVISGWKNRVVIALSRLAPRRLTLAVAARITARRD
ncbi:MAG TPA: SDR family oxidoreductase [Blastocatellia bacterium]|nr:SDR family oxidoreductase [Blastocatellia bacterium]